jgi:subtilisin family serine protease
MSKSRKPSRPSAGHRKSPPRKAAKKATPKKSSPVSRNTKKPVARRPRAADAGTVGRKTKPAKAQSTLKSTPRKKISRAPSLGFDWLSTRPASFSPASSNDLTRKRDNYGRKIFTGRSLVALSPELGTTQLEKMAKRSSLRIASISDASHLTPGRSFRLLQQADGVILPKARVALINPGLEDQLQFMAATREGKQHLLYNEPERYVYPAATSLTSPQFQDSTTDAWGLLATNVTQFAGTGQGIRLAVLDTGLNIAHPDFAGRSVKQTSFIAGEDPADLAGHGTMCAGISCGKRKSPGPRYGVAPGVQLFSGKIIDRNIEGTDSSLLDGIEWALQNQCHIINLSVVRAIDPDQTDFSRTYEDIAARSLKNNCLIIAAAGNYSDRQLNVIQPVAEPANCPSIMAVGALDQDIQVANFSCGGLVQDGGQIDVAAPGVNILSPHLGSRYVHDSGTSFACPMVAGMAALLWEANPEDSAAEIWLKLVQNAKRLDIKASDVGAGLARLP